jgi:hypothetical protein
MARTILSQQWDQYLKLIQKKLEEFVLTQVEEIPKKIYRAYFFNGTVKELKITGVSYPHHLNGFSNYPAGKTPTRVDVDRARNYYVNGLKFDIKKVYLQYEELHDTFVSKSASQFYDQSSNPYKDFLHKEEAEKRALEEKKIHDQREAFQELHKKDGTYNYSENGYKFLGWQNAWNHKYIDKDGNVTEPHTVGARATYLKEDYPEYRNCIDSNHQRIEFSANRRGTDHTVSCPICKIYWKYDSSD